MKWNLRMAAAERGIWKSSELRRMLADAGLEISVGKMSKLWTTTPTTLRLDDLDVICAVLDCTPGDLLTADLAAAAARKPQAEIEEQTSNGSPSIVRPRFTGSRPEPPL
ncbi:Cro/Cl family transcriptional regulator [Leucobacter sp. UCD-THU]|uniref:helix-turn-helix domain-containing protein n=2 Tax=unclassified Leucobacter TaxID=2621730 RepID=UPI0003A4B18E|nr:helix-turn-helix transcriptional regulator [Leucobacter sp. UCD-THU]EYT56753.1 Cro/Cl family transcriptional regulator [Leucobacter sp. UCD-THU]RGE16861.1 XRE family transcriptional regulator [Leucobacter sp. wl10]